MTFWTVLTVFLLFPLLMLTLVFFFSPAWLPLVIHMSTLSALALCWGKFCYFEWRPPLMVLLSMQMLAVTLLVLVLAVVRKTPRYGAFFLESLTALLFTAMCVCVLYGYIELEWLAKFYPSCPPPQAALLLPFPFGTGILLSLWGVRKLRGPNK